MSEKMPEREARGKPKHPYCHGVDDDEVLPGSGADAMSSDRDREALSPIWVDDNDAVTYDFSDCTDLECGQECCDCGAAHDWNMALRGRVVTLTIKKAERFKFSERTHALRESRAEYERTHIRRAVDAAVKDRDLEWFQVIESILDFHPTSMSQALDEGIKRAKRKGLQRVR